MAGQTWVDFLSEEDKAFIRRFVLASGSLKQIAAEYEVTYPTIRLRLDRLIGKLKVVEENAEESNFERLLRAQYADGKIAQETFRQLLTAYSNEQENTGES